MPDPISDVLRGASAWLKLQSDPSATRPEDPELLRSVSQATGLPEAHVAALVRRSWDELVHSMPNRRSVGAGVQLKVASFSAGPLPHPELDGVTIVRIDDTSWLDDSICYRSHATDRKGRTYGTPRNPGVPPISAVNPRFWDVRADRLVTLIRERQHGLFPAQEEAMAQRSNEELIALNTSDPISALAVDGGVSLTGGHHRTNEIVKRVSEGTLEPSTSVRLLIHD